MSSGRASQLTMSLVDRAIRDHGFWKEAGWLLALEEPCAEAAGVLVARFGSGELSGYVVAYLLGQIGHDAGYETVLEILEADNAQLSESYAAVAMARINPGRALADLSLVLRRTQSGAVRQAVVVGLGAIGGTAAKEAIVFALEEGLVRETTAARVLADKFGVTEAELLGWLSGTAAAARLALEVLAERASKSPRPLPPGAEIRRVVFEVAERVSVLDGPTRKIRAWLDEDAPHRVERALVASLTGGGEQQLSRTVQLTRQSASRMPWRMAASASWYGRCRTSKQPLLRDSLRSLSIFLVASRDGRLCLGWVCWSRCLP